MNHRPHVFDLTPEGLRELTNAWGWPKFRAEQVLEWVYRKQIADPQKMTNLGKRDRDLLSEKLRFLSGNVVRHQQATDGVQKLLMEWEEDPASSTPDVARDVSASEPPSAASVSLPLLANVSQPQTLSPLPQTECVMIPAEEESDSTRRTACISSQVGCPVGCKFCASGLGGLEGNLTTGRIVEQVWRLGTLEGVGRISNVVFMGMGEPLANFENVLGAVRTLMADWGMGISARKITISTVGVPAQIRRLAQEELPVTLALSLHAPNDELRRQLIPWAQFVTIKQLLDACRFYFEKTGREITLEYILLRHVNDQPVHARELAELATTLRANVNLIRYNEVKSLPYNRPDTDDVRQFQQVLLRRGVNTHIRASRGRDIAAACGQLRHEARVG